MKEVALELSTESLLLAVSQIGLALGGFAGLLTSFWPSEHSKVLRRSPALHLVLDFSFAALAFGLLPFAVYYVVDDDVTVWKCCSLLLSLFILLELGLWARRIRRGLSILHPKLFYGAFSMNAAVAIAGILNLFYSAPLKIYAAALLWLLVPPIMQLYLFIVDQDRYLSSVRRRMRMRRRKANEAKKAA